MGTLQLFLCIFFCHIISAESHLRYDDDSVVFRDFGGVLENKLFPFDRDFELLPFNDIFGSWRNWPPAFHMDPGFPPFMNAPRVQVSCDEDKLTVVVDKKTFGLALTAADVQLGDNCRSNTELPDQLVFSYQLDECGTKSVLQNGVKGFTNFINLTPKKALSPWWQAPLTVHVSCFPRRFYSEPSVTLAPPVPMKNFNIQVMDSSWAKPVESNSYKRGQVMNLQVSAETRPNQQLFIHSCFSSASPEPQTKPRHAVILNKGWVELNGDVDVCACCSSKCKSSSVKIHSGSKYPGLSSVEKCFCGDWCVFADKEIVSTGLILVDDDVKTNAPMDSEPQASSTLLARSNSPVEADSTVSDSLFLQRELPSSQQGVVVVSQDPTSRLTLWLPGQADAEYGKDMTTWSEDGFSVRLSPNGNYLDMKPPTASPMLPSQSEDADPTMRGSQGGKSWDMNIHTVDVWPIPQTETTEGFGRSTSSEVKTDLPNEISINLLLLEHPKTIPKNLDDVSEEPLKKQLPDQTDEKDTNKSDLSSEEEEPSGVNVDDMVTEDVRQPIIRSKLEFSKGADGSQKLSYEEELNQTETKLVQRRAAGEEKTGRVPRLKGLRSTFMYLMR
ncbi:Zona pellucida sperm-binding protein 3 [Oryzias melastigma]|uniref:Zona pellucida sperm-binding protein 3 n=1 Tax=Oryzias melastigma TaxID=30732 RepID=A0A834F1P4_ORYME|nr:Zona pellucida sperm-binding protein 3 [Oryzias melastigma]